jgi:glutaryl-CoA dehydrogenase
MTTTADAQSAINSSRAPLTAHDFLAIDSSLSDEERLIRDTVRAFVRRDLLDRLPDAYAEGHLPGGFPTAAGQLGLLGLHGYGCSTAQQVCRQRVWPHWVPLTGRLAVGAA